ncbi:DUF6416 domain-containing protein [Actinoplanes regularis]|uniref:DUF6416 domain-containing protein n=1 Tax=Actinoplanes regularis TaxID=52697 RepID=UPI0024A1FE62|nr:DUF6416 domain-containing protein [Actinoplanes regularis]GLW35285.1 hypothetical protein Areg01_82210 [Actinoplanes regularis]
MTNRDREAEPAAADVDDAVESLEDDHPLWREHSGGSGHYDDPEWCPADDVNRAEAFYAQAGERATAILDLLIDHPGCPLPASEIITRSGNAFSNAHAVAGSLANLNEVRVLSERRYPFYWWKGEPGQTRYAMKRSVAELFRRARVTTSERRRCR